MLVERARRFGTGTRRGEPRGTKVRVVEVTRASLVLYNRPVGGLEAIHVYPGYSHFLNPKKKTENH